MERILKAGERKGLNGENTIEKRKEKINIVKYDLEFDIDPLFA